jgi:hypothetical protein
MPVEVVCLIAQSLWPFPIDGLDVEHGYARFAVPLRLVQSSLVDNITNRSGMAAEIDCQAP